MEVFKAWELIGFAGNTEVIDRNLGGNPDYAEPHYVPDKAQVRIVGGRTLYEVVGNDGGYLVRLHRLDTTHGLRAIVRYVDPDTPLEVVRSE